MNHSIPQHPNMKYQYTWMILKKVRRFFILYIHLFSDTYLDDILELQPTRNSSNLKIKKPATTTEVNPSTAVKSIFSSYSQQLSNATPTQPSKRKSRIRAERQFGEVITSGNLLEELKQKAQAKKNKEILQQNKKRRHRSSNK